MIAYHLDRTRKMTPNSVLELITTTSNSNDQTTNLYGFDKVSLWGMSCYNFLENLYSPTNTIPDFSSANSFQIDLQAEIIRQNFFPEKPSRFKSIFAVEKLKEFLLWSDYLEVNNQSHIYEIEFKESQCCKLDAYFLKGGISSHNIQDKEALIKYWSGKMSDNPLPELVIQLPVRVKRLLSPSEFII
ncbi:MAG: DUF2441 domain-containing protein [Anaerostipes sp.]|nr:DUF2441 domain-containing protein [Anaerostipes sp.]